VNSCVNSPEDEPVGPKHVEIRRYMNKIEIVTSVGFSFHMKRCELDSCLTGQEQVVVSIQCPQFLDMLSDNLLVE